MREGERAENDLCDCCAARGAVLVFVACCMCTRDGKILEVVVVAVMVEEVFGYGEISRR